MSQLGDCFFKIYNRILKKNSNLVFRAVLGTPPCETDPHAETILFTLLDRSNYCAYLLAAKSFLQYTPRLRVVIQSDGSLTQAITKTLRDHLPGVEIFDDRESRKLIADSADPQLLAALPPLEQCHILLVHKLLSVLYRCPGKKVILFDSDLLFFRAPAFVVDWIEDGDPQSCFHSDGGSLLAPEFKKIGFDFSRVDINQFNSGFIGFHNGWDQSCLIEVVRRIVEYDPNLLQNWEIEQAIWAVLFNEIPQPVNLDVVSKDYVASGYWPYRRIKESVFAHFVGSIRFKNLRYLRAARVVIRELKDAGFPSRHTASISPPHIGQAR